MAKTQGAEANEKMVAGNVKMETKISKLRKYMANDEWRKAVLMAAKFGRLGTQKGAILSAREAYLRPEFQRAIGKDPAALIDNGIAAMRERYCAKL